MIGGEGVASQPLPILPSSRPQLRPNSAVAASPPAEACQDMISGVVVEVDEKMFADEQKINLWLV